MFLQPKMADNGKKRSQTQSILSFVSKRPREESSDSLTQQELTGETSTEVRAAKSNPTTSSIPAFRPYDFGALKEPFQENQLTDDKKYKVVTSLDQPDDFVSPSNIESGQKRSFQSTWFKK